MCMIWGYLRIITMNNYFISIIPGAGHGCELVKAIRKYIDIQSIYFENDPYGLDFIDPGAMIIQRNFPQKGNKLIIMTAYVYRHLEDMYGKNYFKFFDEVTIIVPDGIIWTDPERFNRAWVNFKVFATHCKIMYRGNYLTREYYQPFDLHYIYKTKEKNLVVSHSPFSKEKEREKGTDYLRMLMKELNVEFRIFQNMKWLRCMQEKAKTHIFIDQIGLRTALPKNWLGGVGKSGMEAMNLRCCTVSCGEFIGREIPAPPGAWGTNDNYKEKIKEVIMDKRLRKEYADRQYEWTRIYTNPDFQARRILE